MRPGARKENIMKKIMLGGMMAALVMVLALAVAPARAETDEAAAVAFVRYVTDHAADINGDNSWGSQGVSVIMVPSGKFP